MRLLPWVLSLAGCFEAPVGNLVTTVSEVTDYGFLATPRDKVDILFMVDDSASMEPKQLELKRRFPDLIRKLEEIGASGKRASYHIGVVTSDLEAGQVCGKTRIDGKARKGGALTIGDCTPLADGKKFIVYDQKSNTNNLPAGQDLAATFGCMASVGVGGCGLEQPLESVYRALHDPIPDNQGFLRDDALLAVVFVTDEDDCSAPTSSDLYASAKTLGPVDSFRCFQYGVACGEPLMSVPSGPNAFSICEPAQGKLFDIRKYINFFTLRKINGGVKPNPMADVLVMAIAGDVTYPITTALFKSQTIPREPCTAFDGDKCIWQIGHTCRSAQDSKWVGDPGLRIKKLVDSARSITSKPRLRSICDGDYSPSLAVIADFIEIGLKNCVDKPFTRPEDPQCTVQDVGPDGLKSLIPYCTRANGYRPCWRVLDNPDCPSVFNPVSGRDQRAAIEIDRAGKPIAGGTTVEIQCATIASRSQ